MKTLLVITPAKARGKTVSPLVPAKLTGWHIQTMLSGSLSLNAVAPDVTLVQLNNDTRPSDLEAVMPELVHIQTKAQKRSYVLFSVKGREENRASTSPGDKFHFKAVVGLINKRLCAFPNPDQVSMTFARNSSEMTAELDQISMKLDLPLQQPGTQPEAQAPRPSPLDRVIELVKATEDLRVVNGNLSAVLVAEAFGLSINELAGCLGRSRQALGKTPDADSIQNQLAFFERVARLRALVPAPDFQKWLRIPNPDLDGKSPLDLLADKEGQVAADLVDDMLTGAPA